MKFSISLPIKQSDTTTHFLRGNLEKLYKLVISHQMERHYRLIQKSRR